MKIESDANSFGFVFELVKESANSVMKRPEANKSDLERSDTEDRAIYTKTEKRKQLKSFSDENSYIKDSDIDMKTTSMRNTLVLSGLPADRGEDTDVVLQDFLQKKNLDRLRANLLFGPSNGKTVNSVTLRVIIYIVINNN